MDSSVARRGQWIQTRSGKQFFPLDVRPEDICIEDIAAGLSKICRYGGQCLAFYSVAEHSIHVSRTVPAQLAMAALLHDAAEAYVGDMVRPLKIMIPDFRRIEKDVQRAIDQRFGIDFDPSNMRYYDDQMLHTEMLVMMKDPPAPWVELPHALDDWHFEYYDPDEAEEAFLLRWGEIHGGSSDLR